MKKLFVFLCFLWVIGGCAHTHKTMSYEDVRVAVQKSEGAKVTALAEDTAPESTDLAYSIDDPAGTPASKKAAWGNVITKAHGLGDGIVVVDGGEMGIADDLIADGSISAGGVALQEFVSGRCGVQVGGQAIIQGITTPADGGNLIISTNLYYDNAQSRFEYIGDGGGSDPAAAYSHFNGAHYFETAAAGAAGAEATLNLQLTISNSGVYVGGGTGDPVLGFDSTSDASITWDVSETELVFDTDIRIIEDGENSSLYITGGGSDKDSYLYLTDSDENMNGWVLQNDDSEGEFIINLAGGGYMTARLWFSGDHLKFGDGGGDQTLTFNSELTDGTITWDSTADEFDINGSINLAAGKDFMVNDVSCCDYVFENDYPLHSLDSLRAFIQAKNHLPGMTINRAGQMSLSVGIKELVVKAEEYALYLLQLDDRIAKIERDPGS